MKVVIVGTGYVGLVSGVCLATRGHNVICVDRDQGIVDRLNKGIPTIYEKGLQELLSQVHSSGNFSACCDLEKSLDNAEVILVAVGTPSLDGAIDLSQIVSAISEIGKYIKRSKKFISIVIKSTVIPSTTDSIVRDCLEKALAGKVGVDFGLGMNPEFLREGNAIHDFMSPDRIVLGYEDELTLNRMRELYSSWEVDFLEVNTRTAEMIKYANNSLLATQISAVNELANIASALGGISFMDVMKGVTLDGRWSPIMGGVRIRPDIVNYLSPGCGFGGSCFPKDVQALRAMGASLETPTTLLDAVLGINELQPLQVEKLLTLKIGQLINKKILVLGLAFKAETDDVRETASKKIIESLLEKGAKVCAHDPIAISNFRSSYPELNNKINYINEWGDFICEADVILIATNWIEYRGVLDHDLGGKVLFDARQMFSDNEVSKSKNYISIGS